MVNDLIVQAQKAQSNAYAPYSSFSVGAALLTKDGTVYTGCNVENASYGLTCCAERVAIFKAVTEGKKEFTALAVVANTDVPCSPCGACRQVMSEFAPQMDVYMADKNGNYIKSTVKELLPAEFGKENVINSRR